ncbi:MAG: YiiX/YebB-like N1pC/P60 family cysteine hydrolase [Candidatus Xenobia bacterium]
MIASIGSKIKQVASNDLVLALDIRVPTTTKHMSDAERAAICQAVQPGDVCLETNDAYPGWQRMERLTMRSNHTHAFLYEGNGKFLQSTTPDGVQRTDLKDYLKGRIHVMVIRPPYQSQDDVKAALSYAASQIGKPYNNAFDESDTKSFYCSQLVSEALKHMPHPIDTPETTFRGRPCVAPDGFKEIPGAKVVIDDHATFWKGQLTHWPVFLSTVAVTGAAATFGALQGGLAGGLVGGLLGLAGGVPLSIATGNKIQCGSFGFGGNISEEG